MAIARAEAVFQSASQPVERAKALPATIRLPKRAYVLLQRLAIGDVADVHPAQAEGTDYVLKVARIPEATHHLETETRKFSVTENSVSNSVSVHHSSSCPRSTRSRTRTQLVSIISCVPVSGPSLFPARTPGALSPPRTTWTKWTTRVYFVPQEAPEGHNELPLISWSRGR